MGTDIHSIIQVRAAANRFHQLDINQRPPPLPGTWLTVAIGVAGDQRNYDTFAMLADVRNGRGFAGIKTSDGFPVICEPRGLPEDLDTLEDDETTVVVDSTKLVTAWDFDGKAIDVSDNNARQVKYLKEDGGRMWLGDHSHSWVTLTELKNFLDSIASKYMVKHYGVVDVEEYRTAKAEGRSFQSWCGDVSGPGVIKVNEPVSEEALAVCTHVRATWTESALECSRLKEVVAALEHVRSLCDVTSDDVRYVFGFDS